MSVDRLREHPQLRYVAAVAATLATIAGLIPLRFLIEPLPAPPFLLTVMVVAWLAGFGPGVVSVILSAAALDYWFIPPLFMITTTWHEIASVVSFTLVGIAVVWLTATRRQAEDDRKALLARERASRASAEAANRAKDEFVAVLGHEFRNPLSAIVNAVQVLERVGVQEDPARHAREVIARQTTSIGRMVEDLLEINRIANGKIRLDPQPMHLAQTVRRCLGTLAGRTEGHRLSLDADEVWVEADPVRLEQIVVNLLDNAVKYTPVGGAIDIRVSREGGHAVLRVRDTGVGIAHDVLPRIFDLFVQGEPDAIRGRSGLGIGLAVVQRLAEVHGATIEAASDGPGRGSTFSLRLRSVPAPGPRMPPGPTVAMSAPRRRIVVAEGDPDLRAILKSLLQTFGHEVSEAADGPSALATAVAARPDVMLIDVALAGFDGYDLARRLRVTPETKATLLVALTGYGRPEDVERALMAGFDHHATKPVDPEVLAELLRR
jgi:signal transduction histidine kinase/CheY-like chemotaxis protein